MVVPTVDQGTAQDSYGGGQLDTQELRLPERHRAVVERFVSACRADERVVAAFLGGSYARGAADRHSDLDLYLISTDQAYSDFFNGRTAFLERLGEPLFLESFSDYGFDLLLFVLSDGTEGELALAPQSNFRHIHGGTHVVLLDRAGLLTGVTFPEHHPALAEQVERLHRLVYWFWHDLSHHFITPLVRGRAWTAMGGLEDLRRTCMDLARLRADFTTAAAGYEQVERTISVEHLSALEATFCPLERDALLRAARALVGFYREVAPPLAQMHGITYPAALERVICTRLDAVDDTSMADEPGT
jgi:predicted nucleotidyltransferase